MNSNSNNYKYKDIKKRTEHVERYLHTIFNASYIDLCKSGNVRMNHSTFENMVRDMMVKRQIEQAASSAPVPAVPVKKWWGF